MKSFLLGLLFVWPVYLFAQTDFCGHHGDIPPLKTNANNSKTSSTEVLKYIPVKLNLVVNDDGTPSENTTLTPLINAIAKSNVFFNPLNIQFYIAEVDTIKETKYLVLDRDVSELNDLYTDYNVIEYADFYMIDKWEHSGEPSTISGVAGTKYVGVKSESFKTLVHELGHFFGLEHTFKTTYGIELVSRDENNCSNTGDFICDTEADPYDRESAEITGEAYSHSYCQMTSNTMDSNGDVFTPPFKNIMSYYSSTCGQEFTPQQYDRMMAYYNQSHTSYTLDAGMQGAPGNLSIQEDDCGEYTLTWNNHAEGYAVIIEASTDGGTIFKTIGAVNQGNTAFTLPSLTIGTDYMFRVKHVNSKDSYSNTVTLLSSKGTYCIPYLNESYYSTYNSGIGKVKINNTKLENVENTQEAYVSFCNQYESHLIIGGTYSLTVEKQYNGFFHDNGYVTIWFDFNQDKDFDDENEKIYHSSNEENIINIPLQIPSNASTGHTRMRVRIDHNNYTEDACMVSSSGDIEDYLIQFIEDGTPSNLVAEEGENETTVDLSWNDSEGELSYLIERSFDGIVFEPYDTIFIESFDHSYTDYPKTGNKTLYYRLKRYGGKNYSNTASIYLPENNSLEYDVCIPETGTQGCQYPFSEFVIDNTTLLLAPSRDSLSCATEKQDVLGYFKLDTPTLHLVPGNTYQFTLNARGYNLIFGIWLDVNRDGIFNETNERMLLEQLEVGQKYNGTITIPVDMLTGNSYLRLRSLSNFNKKSCDISQWGETRDYTVYVNQEISAPKNLTYTKNANTATLSWLAPSIGTPASYRIEKTVDGITYQVEATINASLLSLDVAINENENIVYRVVALDNAVTSEPSNTILIPSKTITAINTFEQDDVVIYPNPSHQIWHISAPGYHTYKIYDINGTSIQENTFTDHAAINSHGLESGIYTLKLFKNDTFTTKKLVKY